MVKDIASVYYDVGLAILDDPRHTSIQTTLLFGCYMLAGLVLLPAMPVLWLVHVLRK